MRTTLGAIIAATLAVCTAQACDDHHGTCEIEDWRWQSIMGGTLMIDGVTTCDEGWARLRLYEGENGPFLGVADGYIVGHTFQALAIGIPKPSTLAIKYSISPE